MGPSRMRTGEGDQRTGPALSDGSLSRHNALKVSTGHMGGLPGSGQDLACEYITDS